MNRFIEFRCDLFAKTLRADVIPLDEIASYINPDKDCYRSIFYSDETFLKHVEKTGSVAGFSGKVGIDTVVFDFDSLTLEKSRQDALTLISRLETKFKLKKDEIGIFFSGNKGFSIDFSTIGLSSLEETFSERTPLLIKQFCTTLAGDLQTFDSKIYQHNRLYRIPGTKHNKPTSVGGQDYHLYKTQLTHDQLKTFKIEKIQEYSKQPRDIFGYDVIEDPTLIDIELNRLKTEIQSVVRKLPSVNSIVNKIIDEKNAPKYAKICIWRLSQGTYTDQRDNTLFAIADHERWQGMPPEVTKGKLTGVLDLMNRNDPLKAKIDPITETDINRIIKQTYSKSYGLSCSHAILDSVCSKNCYLAPLKFSDSQSDVVTFGDAYTRSKQFFKDYQSNLVKTGFPSIDENAPFLVTTMNLMAARPGVGKSSLIFNLLKNLSDNDVHTLFIGMDMSEEVTLLKFAPVLFAKTHNQFMSARDYLTGMSRNNEDMIKKSDILFEKFNKNVRMTSKRGLSIKDIENEIDAFEQTSGKKIKVLIIDYVQLLRSNQKDSYNKNTDNAEYLTQLAKEKKICIIGLSQATNSGEVFNTTGEFFAKGSRTWEDQASIIMNCFRPFIKYGKEGYDNIFSLKIVKNRIDALQTLNLHFHGPSGFMRELTAEEDMERQALALTLKDQEKNGKY